MVNREIVANELVKRYGDFAAVDGVSFKVQSGEIYGFLGPNGAGKSTTIAMLTTLGLPNSGTATVGGYDVVSQAGEVRRVMGVALQGIGLDPLMKPMEMLTLQARIFGMNGKQAKDRAHELLSLVKLTEFINRPVGKFSGGMKRRLDLALSLVHQPQVLFLDEPTTGLDPVSRRDIWNEVKRLNQELGMTIFLTTQYLEEADQLAHRIAIINNGKIAVEGTPTELKARMGGETINLNFADTETVERAMQALRAMVTRLQTDRETLRLYLPNAAAAVAGVVSHLQKVGLSPVSLSLTQPSLDDVFIQVTGERFDNEKGAA